MDLVRAVNHAHVVLAWQENMQRDEVPPEWMWSLDDELESWFEGVEEARKERFNLPDRNRDTVVPMMANDLAREKRRKRGR